jgi:type IV secretion system protein VirB11
VADPRKQLIEGLTHSLGSVIMEALAEPNVIEVMVNPDGNIWVEKLGEEMKIAGALGFHQAKDVVILMAASMNYEAGVQNPVVQGELPDEPPLFGSRFHGILPPIVNPQASFTIRKKASKIFALEEYVEAGILPAQVRESLIVAIARRKNILVVGGTGSGKTTLLNGLIHAMSELCPRHRVLILEDTMELQCESVNKVFMRTSDFLAMGGLVKTTLRFRPDRILIGEVRDHAALDLLKAWNTGHPGGLATIHANSAEEGLDRLEELVGEAGMGPKQKLIGRAVDLVLFIEKTDVSRKVTEAIKVRGFDASAQKYEIEGIYNEH